MLSGVSPYPGGVEDWKGCFIMAANIIDGKAVSAQVKAAVAAETAELAEKGIELMDAPVSGGEPKAIDGTLSVMVGGKKETFDKYYELLMQMAGSVVYAVSYTHLTLPTIRLV